MLKRQFVREKKMFLVEKNIFVQINKMSFCKKKNTNFFLSKLIISHARKSITLTV